MTTIEFTLSLPIEKAKNLYDLLYAIMQILDVTIEYGSVIEEAPDG